MTAPAGGIVAVVAAFALFASACSSDDETADGLGTLEPTEATDDAETDEPAEADEGTEPEDADEADEADEPAEQEVTVDESVTEAFVTLVETVNKYDSGDLSYDELAGLLTDDAAEAGDGVWLPHPAGDQAQGERFVSEQPEVEVAEDGRSATVVDCVWDQRFPTGVSEWASGQSPPGILPLGVTHEVSAQFQLDDDGVWLASSFDDPFSEGREFTLCLPADLEAEMLDLGAASQEAIWDSYTYQWAPDYDGAQLSEQGLRVASARIRNNFARYGNVAVMDGRYRVDIDTSRSFPHAVVVGVCWVQDRWESYDPDTGERASDDNGAQYQTGFLFTRGTVESPWELAQVLDSNEAAREGLGVCEDFDRTFTTENQDEFVQP